MQSVEDETDQAAAQALALETEAELAEFNADPVLKPSDPEGDEDDADAEETRYALHHYCSGRRECRCLSYMGLQHCWRGRHSDTSSLEPRWLEWEEECLRLMRAYLALQGS